MQRRIAVLSVAGGIGQTTLLLHLARALAPGVRRVALLDLTTDDGPASRAGWALPGAGATFADAVPTGAPPVATAARPLAEGLDIVAFAPGPQPDRFALWTAADGAALLAEACARHGDYDVVLVDSARGGGRMASTLRFADWLLLPTRGTAHDGRAVGDTLRFLGEIPGGARPLALVPYAVTPAAAAAVAAQGARYGLPVAPPFPDDRDLHAAPGDGGDAPAGEIGAARAALAAYVLGYIDAAPPR